MNFSISHSHHQLPVVCVIEKRKKREINPTIAREALERGRFPPDIHARNTAPHVSINQTQARRGASHCSCLATQLKKKGEFVELQPQDREAAKILVPEFGPIAVSIAAKHERRGDGTEQVLLVREAREGSTRSSRGASGKVLEDNEDVLGPRCGRFSTGRRDAVVVDLILAFVADGKPPEGARGKRTWAARRAAAGAGRRFSSRSGRMAARMAGSSLPGSGAESSSDCASASESPAEVAAAAAASLQLEGVIDWYRLAGCFFLLDFVMQKQAGTAGTL